MLNRSFLIVIVVTVLLEMSMHQFMLTAPPYAKLLIAELQNELMLLGLVALIIVAIESVWNEDLSWFLDLHRAEWCHLCLFFVMLLNIMLVAFILLILHRCVLRFLCSQTTGSDWGEGLETIARDGTLLAGGGEARRRRFDTLMD